MSGLAPPTQLPPPPPPPGFVQSQASVLGSGIVGLFIQGIEFGLVIAQFSQWFAALDRSDSTVLSTVIIFVTVVGLAQSGIFFASAWSKYVQRFGMFPCEDWGDYVQSIPTLAISVPVQALMIRRCYYLVNKNMFIIVNAARVTLVVSVVVSLWSTVLVFRYAALLTSGDPVRLRELARKSWPYLMSILLPSVLDLTLIGILLYYLTRTAKRVYAIHKRRVRLIEFLSREHRVAICIATDSLRPLRLRTLSPFHGRTWGERPSFLPLFGMSCSWEFNGATDADYLLSVSESLGVLGAGYRRRIGKLYVISLLYMINAQPLKPNGQPTTVISTLTVPMEVMYAHTLDAQGGDIELNEIVVEHGPVRTKGFAV
ncbi:hypothetical protein EDB92DRAFT_1948035 [Lactarius akahatsu]|uniref:Uncharacterized protein n=1 Tax=Lactarius akahatsu TaxID=416441 RepID=A0AAD4LG81_9AGAM|nr:hypothetical protein EDB92DRAFT_1948035 [Lactarius akahatsu]